MQLRPFLFFAAAALVAGSASAATIWDESMDGDLGDPGSPTAVALAAGSNVIMGSVQASADTRDTITFTIGAGQSLVALNQLLWQDGTSGGLGNRGYHAINAGATSQVPGPANISFFLGGAHMDAVASGTDLLPNLGIGFGTGFTPPLGPGTYSYLVQQTGPPLTIYSLEFVVTPEPSLLALLGASVLVFAHRRRS